MSEKLEPQSAFDFSSAFTYNNSDSGPVASDTSRWSRLLAAGVTASVQLATLLSLPLSWPLLVRRVPSGHVTLTYRLGRLAAERRAGRYLHWPAIDSDCAVSMVDTALTVAVSKTVTVDAAIVDVSATLHFCVTSAVQFVAYSVDTRSLLQSTASACLCREVTSNRLDYLTDNGRRLEVNIIRQLNKETKNYGISLLSLTIDSVDVLRPVPAGGATVQLLRCFTSLFGATSNTNNTTASVSSVPINFDQLFGIRPEKSAADQKDDGEDRVRGVAEDRVGAVSEERVEGLSEERVVGSVGEDSVAGGVGEEGEGAVGVSASREGDVVGGRGSGVLTDIVQRMSAVVVRLQCHKPAITGIFGLQLRQPRHCLLVTLTPDKSHVVPVDNVTLDNCDAIITTTSHVLFLLLDGSPQAISLFVRGLVSVQGDLDKVRFLFTRIAKTAEKTNKTTCSIDR